MMNELVVLVVIGLVSGVATHTDSCDVINVNIGDRSAKPDFVAFSMASGKNIGPVKVTSLVPLEIELYNDGGYFRADNRFHAPVKGVYTFSFSGVSHINDWVHLYLYKEKVSGGAKVAVVNARDTGTSGGRGAAGATVMIKLDAGDKVSLWCDIDESLIGGNPPSTLFSGKLEKRLD